MAEHSLVIQGLLALDLAGPPSECSGPRMRFRWLKRFHQEKRCRAQMTERCPERRGGRPARSRASSPGEKAPQGFRLLKKTRYLLVVGVTSSPILILVLAGGGAAGVRSALRSLRQRLPTTPRYALLNSFRISAALFA